MPHRQPCAGAIVLDEAGRLLLVRRGRAPSIGSWSIPGGRCLPGEPSAAACVREVAEETGLAVEVSRLAGTVERPAPDGSVYVIDDYVCRLVGGTLAAGDDATDARWVSRAELPALPLVPGLVDALAEWDLLPGPAAVVRAARPTDVRAVCDFGASYVPPHCAPLVGPAAAEEQVRMWWNEDYVSRAIAAGFVVVGDAGGELVGVAQRGRRGDDHVIYKLYVHPEHRGGGLGRRLIDALVSDLPAGTDRVYVEQFVSNERAGVFYEREGFVVDTVEPSRTGDPRAATVWRVRALPSRGDSADPRR